MLSLVHLKSEGLLASRKEKLMALFLLKTISKEALVACDVFLKEQYEDFDAQVGDTFCQARAYKICFLAGDKLFLKMLSANYEEIRLYHQDLSEFFEKYKKRVEFSSFHEKDLDSKQTTNEFFLSNGLEKKLHSDIKFIITAYLLSKYAIRDSDNSPTSIDMNLIKSALCVTSTNAKLIVKHYQALLSRLSCDFIFSLLSYYPISDGNVQFLRNFLLEDDKGRQMLPHYNGTKVLLINSLGIKLPIMLSVFCVSKSVIRKVVFLFKYNHATNSLDILNFSEVVKHPGRCIVFKARAFLSEEESVNDYITRLLQNSPINLILNNAAVHPQYSGSIREALKLNPYLEFSEKIKDSADSNNVMNVMREEFFNFKMEASQLGCSRENESLFFMTHIYCSAIKKEAKDSLFYSIEGYHNVHHEPIISINSEPYDVAQKEA